MRPFALTLLFFFALCSAASAYDFYERKHEGWFFYEPFPVDPEPEKKEPVKEQAPKKEAPPTKEEVVEEEKRPEAETIVLSSQWLRENLDQYRDKALDNPTRENVAVYMYLQKLAMDKATQFADTYKQVVLSDPYLDENTRRPLSTFGAKEANIKAEAGKDDALAYLSDKAGIWFFYRSDCSYCDLEMPLLKILQDRYGIQIFPISLDGQPLPDNPFGRFMVDAGQAKQLGVMQTPALFLVKPGTQEIYPLAQALIALPDLKERIFRTAHQAGWLPQKMYEDTKPVRTNILLNPNPEVPKDLLENPGALIRTLREEME